MLRRFRSGPQSDYRGHVSSSLLVKPSMPRYGTGLSSWLHPKVYETVQAGNAFGRSPRLLHLVRPNSSRLGSLPLEIKSPSQVLHRWTSYHPVLAFRVVRDPPTAGRLRSAGSTPPLRDYSPVRHPLAFGPLPGVAGYRAYLAPVISHRGEEGFSSCSVRPCHRGAAITPPKWVGGLNQVSAAHAAFASGLRARPSEYGTLEATSAFTCVAAR